MNTRMKIAINGFGRIGRTLAGILLGDNRFEIVAINDLADVETMSHLFKYDSVHGMRPNKISFTENKLVVDNEEIRFFSEPNIELLPWKELEVDVVVECTGKRKNRAELEKHLSVGAKRVLLSVPPQDESIHNIVLGVNDELIQKEDTIISNASCTTNNAAPMIKLIDELCGIESCYITTIHSYTSDQRLHDAPHKDLRRSRAAAVSIIPTTTGAAKALTKVFPHLEGRMGGCGIRVPVPNGSLTDITCIVTNPLTVEQINEEFEKSASGQFSGILQYTEDPIVSIDIVNNPHSCIFDAQLTSVIGNMVKVVGWYDNEFGYSNRLRDMLVRISNF